LFILATAGVCAVVGTVTLARTASLPIVESLSKRQQSFLTYKSRVNWHRKGGRSLSKVLLFSTSTCSWCRRAKRYFKERRVPFKEINIERDPDAARDIVRKTGQTGVPVIKIGNRWIVGFDKERIDKELAC
jgi:glutaredoxin 3